MRLRLIIACTALQTLPSCAPDRPDPGPVTGATATGSLTISAAPVRTIAPTDSDGAPRLANIADATRLGAGTIVVVDRGVQAVLFFDSTGQLSSEVGRAGQGPGEYRAVGGIGQCAPDTLFVWDPGNDRLSVLDARGNFLRAYPLAHQLVGHYCAGAGSFVVWERFLNSTAPGPGSPPVRGVAQLVSTSGQVMGVLGEFQAGENRPLGALPQFAVTGQGVYVGTADTAMVSLYAPDGRLLRSLVVGERRRAPTDAEYDAAVAALATSIPGTSAERATMRAFLRERFPKPKYLPAYRAVLADPAGRVYVVTSPRGTGVTDVAVFDPTGASIGQLRIPGDLDLVEVGAGYLLGIREDEAEGSAVVEYELGIGGS